MSIRDENKQESSKYRRWLGFTLGGTLALLGGLGAVTAAVDPFFHFHGPLKELAYPIDSERYQNDGISRHFDYDGVITGTSMTENFKGTLADELFGVTSIKIPFGGGYYKEVDQAIRRALSYNPNIKMVLRSLDKSFLMYDKDEWNPTAPVAEYLTDSNPWNDVNYIWNKEVIFGNVRGVLNFTRAGGHTTAFDEYMHWAPEREWGKEAVLKTFSPPQEYLQPVEFTEEDRQRLAENLEQNVLAVARANPDVTFYYFIPPYSIGYWHSELVAKGNLERELAALRLMADMLLECDNIRLFAFDDKFDIICNLDYYMDAIHYSEEVGDQLLVWMAEGENLLTKENVDEYFHTITKFYTSYDYADIYE